MGTKTHLVRMGMLTMQVAGPATNVRGRGTLVQWAAGHTTPQSST